MASSTPPRPRSLARIPAEVREDFGDFKKGLRILKPEEDTGFQLLASLTPEQRKQAIIAEKAPNDLARRGATTAAERFAGWTGRDRVESRATQAAGAT